MLNLKGIINQLNKEEFADIANRLEKSKADKFKALLNYYREKTLTDGEIIEKIEVTPNAYYVIKHRLFEKIQEYLLENTVGPKTDILRKLVAIPNLLFNTPRNIANTVLTKLEKDLLANDMPNELTSVYNALKKLHLHSDKYYEYTQLYNKHVAYTLAIDKSEDLLTDFVKNIGLYYCSREGTLLETFSLIKKEISNVSRLYESHHLKVYKNILNASTEIFLPLSEETINDDPVEDILRDTESIISQYPKDFDYQYIINVINFLFYEYYNNLGLHKKADQYFSLLNIHLPSFLYYSHYTFCSKFLISKAERYIRLNIEDQLYEENEISFKNYDPNPDDIPNCINYVKYLAISAFYRKKHDEATKLISGLFNEVSFKQYPHSEIEMRLFLVLTYSFCDKYDLAWNLLRNVSRKIRELNKDMTYENAVVFAGMLKTQSSQKGNVKEKLIKSRDKFELLNRGAKRMLEFIKMDETFISALARPIKS